MKRLLQITFLGVLLLACVVQRLHAETGEDAWLRYAPLAPTDAAKYDSLPATVTVLGDSPLLATAQTELIRGVKGMLGRTLRAENGGPTENAFVLGTIADIRAAAPVLALNAKLTGDGFLLTIGRVHGFACTIIAGADERGVLYGVFAFLSKIAQNENVSALNDLQQPAVPLRWVNEWDNLNGTIEHGFGGRSIFFDNGAVQTDLTRVDEYARLLASVGINGCAVNNVNANPLVLHDDFLPQLARIADVFRRWGVQLAISVDVSSPKVVGGLDTFDPLDPKVAEFWRAKTDQIYKLIPDFGGFVVKADSEGRPGPSAYGRTPADAANVIARALKPHGGVLFYRAFVYDHHLDWTNLKNDRARAAYDIFHPLDGQFDDNVIVQIKNGPIDFQVREPVSPLFGGLKTTNEAIELQIVQEYTGQERHLCFLVPMWKEVLDFDLRADGAEATLVKALVSGKVFGQPTGGFVGVSNVGLDPTWDGYVLAMANLYGFGRLAWNPNLSANAIADEWTRLTFGNDPLVVRTIAAMQLGSWRVYEGYTGPLGLGTLTNILGAHYGPAPESAENNGWGQWLRADHQGIGMDRTMATGTGFIGQYSLAVQKKYEPLADCPDNLLLFFHHVPYTYVLHSGKTVIQHVYDSHYDGASAAAAFVSQWKTLTGRVDDDRYAAVLARLEYQAGHAIVWRDAISNWFLAKSGIPDARGRVGHYPNRIEAESMQLDGYVPFDVTPPEAASGGRAVECAAPAKTCVAEFRFSGTPGWYELDVEYFDQANGASKFRVSVNHQTVDTWLADEHLPALKPNADSSTRRRIPGLALRPGDEIRIEGTPDGQELAPLDYVEIFPREP
ncbi:MAG: alpha-glucuronidase family glycosyl hydrolase [Candidatus Acidiferrales bacterium]